MYCGWRARIGLIMPGNGTNPEYEFHKYAPEGVTVMTQRVLFERVDPEGLREMGGRIDSAAKLLATAHPDLVLFGCTSGSLIGGFGYDLELIKRMEGQCGAKALTTSSAVLMALKALGAKRVVVATPYVDRVNEIEKKFLEENNRRVRERKGRIRCRKHQKPGSGPDAAYAFAADVSLDQRGSEPSGGRHFCQLHGLGYCPWHQYDGTGFRPAGRYEQSSFSLGGAAQLVH